MVTKLATQLYFKTFASYRNQCFSLSFTALLKWWIKLSIAKSFGFFSRESTSQMQIIMIIIPSFAPGSLPLGKSCRIFVPPGLHL